jgi:hypothetical protein
MGGYIGYKENRPAEREGIHKCDQVNLLRGTLQGIF